MVPKMSTVSNTDMKISVLLIVIALWASVSEAQNDEKKQDEPTNIKSLITQKEAHSPKKNKFLFGTISSVSHTMVIHTTSTVFYSCVSRFQSTNRCNGRKKRRVRRNIDEKSVDMDVLQ